VDFDRYGNAFVSACVIDHLFHMAPGGIYFRQGGVPANPYAYELLPSIVDHKHHMAAYCGICIYQGDQFPDEYQGHVFMGNIHQCAINQDRLTPNGSSFKATAEKDFLTTRDGWFRPVSEQVGPDGELWVADWYDKYPCYQNAQADPEGVDRAHGRIWRVVYTGNDAAKRIGSRPESKMNLSSLSNLDLVTLLAHPNVWQRRMAQRILAERSDRNPAMRDERGSTLVQDLPDVRNQLEEMLRTGTNVETRLAALWALYSIAPGYRFVSASNRIEALPDLLEKLADSSDAPLRACAIRFLGEQIGQILRAIAKGLSSDASAREFCEQKMARFENLARDPDPTIRLAVATACREIVSTSLTVDTDVNATAPVARTLRALTESSADAKDPLLPFMIWMVGEPLFAVHPEGALAWLAGYGPENMPLAGILARKAMRRLCDTAEQAKINLLIIFLEQIADQTNGVTLDALDGLLEGQRAKPMVPKGNTSRLFAAFQTNAVARIRERSQELGAIWGNAPSIQATLRAINNPQLPVEERSKAIAAAKLLSNNAATEALLVVIRETNPESLVLEAMQAAGALGGNEVPREFLNRWNAFSSREKAAAADVLVSRSSWAGQLLSAVETKQISPLDLPTTAVRSLADSKNEFVRQRARQAIGTIRPVNEDKQKIIAEKKEMILKGGPPDLKAGHELAKKTCLVCHKLGGEGAEVGPDLTGVGRSSLDALLANVIDPNQVIGKGYENVIVQTKDDRTLNGRLTENTDTRIKLLSSGPKEDVIAKSDIVSMRISDVSVMPEGLEQMPDQDFRCLILYVLNAGQDGK
jgi:putative heme-binding domain-containing protein